MTNLKENNKNQIQFNLNQKIIEALIFSSSEPISYNDLKKTIVESDLLDEILTSLEDKYSASGINLNRINNTFAFRTSPEVSEYLNIEKIVPKPLSRAATETLAIIAYHQPITRSEIENIRGVQMGRGSLDHLMEIGWIRPSGRKSIPGKPTLWSTTDLFVEHFGLNSLSDLPNKEELKASGFLDKRAAIATISDLAKNDENLQSNDNLEQDEENNIDDFIQNT